MQAASAHNIFSQEFLIKRPHVSVVGTLDLSGFGFEIDVISGRTRTVELVNELIRTHGSDPAAWLPALRAARLGPSI